MIQVRGYEKNDFSGGIIDYYVDAPPQYAKTCNNLLIDANRKLNSRPGYWFWLNKVTGVSAQLKAHVGSATMAAGTPGKVQKAAHGFYNKDAVSFVISGTFPTGIVGGQIYYVQNRTANDFEISLTPTGSSLTFDITTGASVTIHSLSRLTSSITVVENTPLESVDGSEMGLADDLRYWVKEFHGTTFSLTLKPGLDQVVVLTNNLPTVDTTTLYLYVWKTPHNTNASIRTGDIINYDNDTQIIRRDANKLYYPTASGWTQALGPSATTAWTNTLAASNKTDSAQWNAHVFLTTDDRRKPIKAWYTTADGVVIRTAGLPDLAESPTTTASTFFNTLRNLFGKYSVQTGAKINSATGKVEATAHGYTAGTALHFTIDVGGTLPAEVVVSGTYYVIASGLTANEFKISLTAGGAAIVFTSTTGNTVNIYKNADENLRPRFTWHVFSIDGSSPPHNATTYPILTLASAATYDAWVNNTTPSDLFGLLKFAYFICSDIFVHVGEQAVIPSASSNHQNGTGFATTNAHSPISDNLNNAFATPGYAIAALRDLYNKVINTGYIPSDFEYYDTIIKAYNTIVPVFDAHDAERFTHGSGFLGTRAVNNSIVFDANTYTYAFVYYYTYTIGDVTFEDYGPVTTKQLTGISNPGTTNVVWDLQIGPGESNYTNLTTSGDHYDVTNADTTKRVQVKIYRTLANGSVFYYLKKTGQEGIWPLGDTNDFIDTFTDQELLDNGQTLYTTGGVLDNDPPPKAKYIHVARQCGWYGNVIEGSNTFPQRVRQSIPGDPDSCPTSLFIDMEEEVTGISSLNSDPIVFCKNHVVRLDGTFDELGRGGIEGRKIHERAGCVSHYSIVQTINGLYWAGNDGFYATNGYTVQKISEGLNSTYKNLVSSTTRKERIRGVFDKSRNIIVWSMSQDSDANDVLFILDLKFPVTQHSVFTTASIPAAALGFFKGELLYGDANGFIFEFKDAYYKDPKIPINLSYSPEVWTNKAIIYTYEDVSNNFGTTQFRKWVPNMIVTAKNVSSCSIQPISNNDDGRIVQNLEPIRSRTMVWSDEEVIWGDPLFIWGQDGLVEHKRFFPAKGLRCSYKQVGLTNADVIIVTSDTVNRTATVDSVLKTVVMNGSSPPKWIEEAVDYYIAFSSDGYANRYLITVRTDTTLSYYDPDDETVDQTTAKWQISGIPKNERFNLISHTVFAGPVATSQTPFQAPERGGNS
jgi:hypothetical protein